MALVSASNAHQTENYGTEGVACGRNCIEVFFRNVAADKKALAHSPMNGLVLRTQTDEVPRGRDQAMLIVCAIKRRVVNRNLLLQMLRIFLCGGENEIACALTHAT